MIRRTAGGMAHVLGVLMARLSIGWRLWIIFALFLAPLSLLTYLFWTQSRGDIAFADKEIQGSHYLSEIWPQFVQSARPEAKRPRFPTQRI